MRMQPGFLKRLFPAPRQAPRRLFALPIEQPALPFLSLAVFSIAVIAVALAIWAELSTEYDAALHRVVIAGLLAVCLVSGIAYLLRRWQVRHGLPDAHQIAQARRECDAAIAANEAKSRYLANVSHEIRSPLNAIYGYAQLVERDEDIDARDAARVIRRSAEHLTSLVEGLLDISQLENGVLRVKTDVIRFAPFLDHLVWMLRPTATAKGLEFHYILPERMPEFVRMDQSRLRQVLINLLSNAIKFTDVGSVTFRVSWSGQMAVFEISDTGPGIAPQDHGRIFDPYERGSDETRHNRPGVGLGLPIAKAIVDILGGNLELDSTPGHGATFRVTMLLGQVSGMMQDTAPSRRVSGYDGPQRSILLVDDDIRQLSFMRSLLEGLGFDVAAVPNGETGVALARTRRFDLAILDISLPGISGWETALQLRERLSHTIHIIMLSANTPEFHKPEFPNPVHDLFLVKPVEFGALIDAVGGLLNLAWNWEALTPDPADQPAAAASRLDLSEAARGHVERLRDSLRIGHVRGIEAEIKLLAQAAPESGALIAVLYDCLDRFDLAAMARKLEEI